MFSVPYQLFSLSGRAHKSIFFLMITYSPCSVDIVFLLFFKKTLQFQHVFALSRPLLLISLIFVWFFKALQLQNLFWRALFVYLLGKLDGEHRYCGNKSQEHFASVLAQQCTETTSELLRGRSSACINCHSSIDINVTMISYNI